MQSVISVQTFRGESLGREQVERFLYKLYKRTCVPQFCDVHGVFPTMLTRMLNQRGGRLEDKETFL